VSTYYAQCEILIFYKKKLGLMGTSLINSLHYEGWT
jgi:hypothetical protein